MKIKQKKWHLATKPFTKKIFRLWNKYKAALTISCSLQYFTVIWNFSFIFIFHFFISQSRPLPTPPPQLHILLKHVNTIVCMGTQSIQRSTAQDTYWQRYTAPAIGR